MRVPRLFRTLGAGRRTDQVDDPGVPTPGVLASDELPEGLGLRDAGPTGRQVAEREPGEQQTDRELLGQWNSLGEAHDLSPFGPGEFRPPPFHRLLLRPGRPLDGAGRRGRFTSGGRYGCVRGPGGGPREEPPPPRVSPPPSRRRPAVFRRRNTERRFALAPRARQRDVTHVRLHRRAPAAAANCGPGSRRWQATCGASSCPDDSHGTARGPVGGRCASSVFSGTGTSQGEVASALPGPGWHRTGQEVLGAGNRSTSGPAAQQHGEESLPGHRKVRPPPPRPQAVTGRSRAGPPWPWQSGAHRAGARGFPEVGQ
jgi:hypothetical protein